MAHPVPFFSDRKLLLRQAIAAWLILFASVVIFATLATLLSLLVRNRELVILVVLGLVSPISIGVHIFLKNRSYYLVKIAPTKSSRHFAMSARGMEVAHSYLFRIMALLAIVIGTVWVLYAPIMSPIRDFGVALLTFGFVSLAFEYFVRRQFANVVERTTVMAAEAFTSPLTHEIDELRSLVSLGNDFRSLGIKRIDRDLRNFDLPRYLHEAEPMSEIRILGTSLRQFTHWMIPDIIARKIETGCRIKMLVLDPDSEFVKRLAQEQDRHYEDIDREIRYSISFVSRFIDKLPLELRQRMELRTYDASPTFFLFGTGTAMVVGFYLQGIQREFSPYLELEIKEGGISTAFLEHFERLWNRGSRRNYQEARTS